MFETSKDILNLVLAFSIVGISVFICWFLYYIITSIKKLHDIFSLFQKALQSFNELVENAKKKLKNSSTHLKLIGMLVQKIVEEIKDRNEKRKKTNKKNTKNKNSKK
jgi:predicted  nucleic acid-binding Zn-ribbon protein